MSLTTAAGSARGQQAACLHGQAVLRGGQALLVGLQQVQAALRHSLAGARHCQQAAQPACLVLCQTLRCCHLWAPSVL